MKDFFTQKMSIPTGYPLPYIIFLIAVATLCFILIKYFKKHPTKFSKVILRSWIILSILEGVKLAHEQLVRSGNWLNVFPFHLCSMPLYFIPFYLFSKSNKNKQTAADFLATFGLIGGAISLLMPSGLFSGHVFTTYYSLLWHAYMVVIAILLISRRIAINSNSNFKNILVAYTLCLIIAQILNYILKDISKINLFFISLYKPSTIPIFKEISITYGNFLNSILFSIVVAFSAFIVYKIIKKTLSH